MHDSIYVEIKTMIITMAVAHNWRKLTCRRNFWSEKNVLYLDYGGGYMSLPKPNELYT